MSYSKEFHHLLSCPLWAQGKHYIGVGNPDAGILIVGKECAVNKESDFYREDYARNFERWQTRDSSLRVEDIKEWQRDWHLFDPFVPYKGQRFTIERRGRHNGGTSTTWYNYQKLTNLIREQGKLSTPSNTATIDFYQDCFITELNELCRSDNTHLTARERTETEQSIRNRLDLMRATSPFWSHFHTVILACGPYSKVLRENKELRRSIFGAANVIAAISDKPIPQLSYAISNDLLRAIAGLV